MGDSLLGRDVLVVNRISKAPTNTRSGFFGYAGDEINENVIRFEKGPNNKLFLAQYFLFGICQGFYQTHVQIGAEQQYSTHCRCIRH